MTIQWYPGHMAKAKRQVAEKLKLVDVVIELVDARLPLSSRNPMIDELTQDKPRFIVLNKKDKADPEVTTKWKQYFEHNGRKAIAVNAQSGQGIQKITSVCVKLTEEKREKMRKKGMKPRAVRSMILGIPNVGKSSLINRLTRRSAADTGDRPAVTKAQQWFKAGKTLELLDTPGILWPKFEDPAVGLRLAASGAIKEDIFDKMEVAFYMMDMLKRFYPDRFRERYSLDEWPEDPTSLLEMIGQKRGCLASGGRVDLDKASELLIREVRSGKLGAISFERPQEV